MASRAMTIVAMLILLATIGCSKPSEMYFRKISPSTTCLYSAASMLLRSLSAASQSVFWKPKLAPFWPSLFEAAFDFRFAMFGSVFVVGFVM